jgi:hypothetical protein
MWASGEVPGAGLNRLFWLVVEMLADHPIYAVHEEPDQHDRGGHHQQAGFPGAHVSHLSLHAMRSLSGGKFRRYVAGGQSEPATRHWCIVLV